MFLGSHLRDYNPPGGRLPPPEVVRGLREIDPRMELVYVGGGVWRLGKVEFANDRYAQALGIYGNALEKLTKVHSGDFPEEFTWSDFLRMAETRLRERYLLVQGFQPMKGVKIAEHQLHSGLVEWFRVQDWIWKFDNAAAEAEREAEEDTETDLVARQKEVSDRFEAVHKEVHRTTMRGARSFGVNVDLEIEGAEA